MHFFFDRNMPPPLVGVFREIGLDSVHHNSLFSETTEDPAIIEYVSHQDLILMTYDRRMIRVHRAVLLEFKPRAVFLSATIGTMKIAEQKNWYQTVWASVCRNPNIFTPQTQIRVDVTGSVRVLWTPEISVPGSTHIEPTNGEVL